MEEEVVVCGLPVWGLHNFSPACVSVTVCVCARSPVMAHLDVGAATCARPENLSG